VPGSGWSCEAGEVQERRTSSSTPATEYAACWLFRTSSSSWKGAFCQNMPVTASTLQMRTTGTQALFAASNSISAPSSVSYRHVAVSLL
jgi:hypothetical protein